MARTAAGSFSLASPTKKVSTTMLFVAGEGGGSAMRASLQRYESAMRQMEVRFEVLDPGFELKKNRNPIHHDEPAREKPGEHLEAQKDATCPSPSNPWRRNIFRYCGRAGDLLVYRRRIRAAQSLKQDDLEIEVKDCIEHPETETGIEALHVIVRIPVYFMYG